MTPKIARRLLKKLRHKFAVNKMDAYQDKQLKRFERGLLKVLRQDVRACKNPASIRLLNEVSNQ